MGKIIINDTGVIYTKNYGNRDLGSLAEIKDAEYTVFIEESLYKTLRSYIQTDPTKLQKKLITLHTNIPKSKLTPCGFKRAIKSNKDVSLVYGGPWDELTHQLSYSNINIATAENVKYVDFSCSIKDQEFYKKYVYIHTKHKFIRDFISWCLNPISCYTDTTVLKVISQQANTVTEEEILNIETMLGSSDGDTYKLGLSLLAELDRIKYGRLVRLMLTMNNERPHPNITRTKEISSMFEYFKDFSKRTLWEAIYGFNEAEKSCGLIMVKKWIYYKMCDYLSPIEYFIKSEDNHFSVDVYAN